MSRSEPLSSRERRVLEAVIQTYVQTAEPAGSRTVSRRFGLGVSPATIRNTMSDLEEKGFLFQVLASQPPGTSDTSRMATDHIDNPSVINPIQYLAHRPVHTEQMPGTRESEPFANSGADEHGRKSVPHVLKDGADSIGIAGASLRVYVNIGMCSDFWLPHHDLIHGRRPQRGHRLPPHV